MIRYQLYNSLLFVEKRAKYEVEITNDAVNKKKHKLPFRQTHAYFKCFV